jgi:hypothetical protein
LAFLERVFRGTSVTDRQQEFNYYLALKHQLLDMEKAQISQKFYKKGGGHIIDFSDESESQNPKF